MLSIPHGLNAEQKAFLGAQVVGAQFEADDERTILEALTHGTVVNVRRKQQDGMNFLQYISAHEWAKMKQKIGHEQIGNVLLSVLFDRLCLYNLSEPTKKLVASVSLLLSTDPESVSYTHLTLPTKA